MLCSSAVVLCLVTWCVNLDLLFSLHSFLTVYTVLTSVPRPAGQCSQSSEASFSPTFMCRVPVYASKSPVWLEHTKSWLIILITIRSCWHHASLFFFSYKEAYDSLSCEAESFTAGLNLWLTEPTKIIEITSFVILITQLFVCYWVTTLFSWL